MCAVCTPAERARATRAEFFRRAWMALKWPRRSRGSSLEIRRHQETAPEEIPRGAGILPGGRRAPGTGTAEGGRARRAPQAQRNLPDARLRTLVERAAHA